MLRRWVLLTKIIEFYIRCCERSIGAMFVTPPRELMGKFTYRF